MDNPMRRANPNTSHGHPNGDFLKCLMDPKNYLARTPQSTTKTIVVKLFREITVTANASGNIAVLFMPQCIHTGTGIILPLAIQNAALYTNTATPETITGFVGSDFGKLINNTDFSGARCISANIKISPNVSLTTAKGKGLIAVLRITSSASNPTASSPYGTVLSALQQTSTIRDSNHVTFVEVAKMQSMVADWIPHEGSDLIDFPTAGFASAAQLVENHPNENVVVGIYTGLPANSEVNIQMVFNLELIPEGTNTGALYKVLADYSMERTQPILLLHDAMVKRNNLTYFETL